MQDDEDKTAVECVGVEQPTNADETRDAEKNPLPSHTNEKSTPATATDLRDDTATAPPDGGFQAWLQVLSSHLIVFNSWGFLISFGIFQPYYQQALSMPPSTVSWVGSVQVSLIFLVGTLSGRAFDAGYFWALLAAGSLLQLVGIFGTSVATRYWQFFLAQGVCQGLGCGLVFAPTVANTSTWFRRRRVMAISLAACGTSTGGMVFPLMAQQLLPRIGFQWTLRAMGLVVLTAIALVFATARTRLPPRRSGPLLELAAFKEPTYALFTVSAWLTLWATYFGYYYARSYALDVLSAPESSSFTILLIINAIGIPGRLIPAFLADGYFGPVTTFIPSIFCLGVVIFAWAGVRSLPGNYVWVVVFGFFGASVQALFPSTCASLTKDLSKNGTRLGMVFTVVSVAALTGPPVAGKLIQVADGSYIGAQVWGGVCLMLGTGFMVAARAASLRENKG